MASDIDSANMRGYNFEREVASIFRALGGRVEHDVALAGNQIDVLVREQTPSGTAVTTAIECKAFSRPVGIDIVNAYAGLAHLLKQRGVIDRAVIVASGGFTKAARESASVHGVELLEIDDLRQRVSAKGEALSTAVREFDADTERLLRTPRRPRIFVVMPFDRAFNDVYLLGIREVAERIGCVVERADEIEHNGYIVDAVQDRVRAADVVVADTTMRNPNVFYEVGYAHALNKPTVLICREGENLPFDVQAVNYIIYGSIVDLRERLERRFRSMLGSDIRGGSEVGGSHGT